MKIMLGSWVLRKIFFPRIYAQKKIDLFQSHAGVIIVNLFTKTLRAISEEWRNHRTLEFKQELKTFFDDELMSKDAKVKTNEYLQSLEDREHFFQNFKPTRIKVTSDNPHSYHSDLHYIQDALKKVDRDNHVTHTTCHHTL